MDLFGVALAFVQKHLIFCAIIVLTARQNAINEFCTVRFVDCLESSVFDLCQHFSLSTRLCVVDVKPEQISLVMQFALGLGDKVR